MEVDKLLAMNNNEAMDDFSESKDINTIVIQLIKECITFLSYNDVQLGRKFYNLNLLYSMWNKDTVEDYSAEVYASVARMFAANVFRPLPPSSYATPIIDETTGTAVGGIGGRVIVTTSYEDESAETGSVAEAEFTQTSMVYQVFRAFVDRQRFDTAKAEPYLDRRFVNGLVHRLGTSDAVERLTVRDTVARVWQLCPAVRGHVLHAAVAELADFAYGYAPRHNGVDELLDFFADTVVYAHVKHTVVDKLCRTLIHLLKHQLLFLFKSKLIECVKTLNIDNKDLIPQMLIIITKIWSNQNLKSTALLGTMVELYNWCAKDKWIQLQLKIVGHLCKLFSDIDFQLSDGSMHFWYTILNENIMFWQNRPNDAKIVADALQNVIRTHWNADCVKTANSLLYVMVMKNVIKDRYVGDPME